ncbi:MAG: hypothetical protein QGH77_04895 [Planctomycetota bacterium]|jgi:hypothetical protein|nr:hypothetical protein [Planctomycetota bacterium]|tara:strand:+ start:4919 stop:6760 length:1842 start_codon:yes stop_codon:yes gene_type:complete
MRRLVSLASFLLLSLTAGIFSPAEAGAPEPQIGLGEVHVLPFGMMEHVRDSQATVPMQVQLYNQGELYVQLQSLQVFNADHQLLSRVELQNESLPGDGGMMADAYYLMEKLDPEFSHRWKHRIFIPLEERPELTPEEASILQRRLLDTVAEVKRDGGEQMHNVRFEVDLASVFGSNPSVGDEQLMLVELDYYNPEGELSRASTSHTIQLLAPYLPPPSSWTARMNGSSRSSGAWYAGDFHVHNCRDEATNGCPDCDAEALNTTGSFSNADLKPQFQALGLDFFSTTTHSYCINNISEFDAVKAESENLDEAGFRILCGTELTTREAGSQSGSDPYFDAQCLLVFHGGIAHYGGHNITSRKPGGEDGWLGYCLDPMMHAVNQAKRVNEEGGFMIANHPGGNMISNNSVAMFKGIEGGMTVACEVWNADNTLEHMSPAHKSWWISRLLEGKFTFPASGSDTHDAAHEFGSTHVWINGTFDDAAVGTSMREGTLYLSNGPFLSVSLADNHGHRKEMGGVIFASRSLQHDYPVTVEAPYNVGTDVGTLRVYRGGTGDSSETLLREFQNVTGQGTLQVLSSIPNPNHQRRGVWYRTEFESSGNPQKSAYSSIIIVALR